jgi:hypothetical protein
MRGQLQAVVAVLMASAVMLILVSPAVPSPLTTVPSKHSVRPPQVVVQLATILLTAAFVNLTPLCEMLLSPPVRLGASGSDLVDLNTARLC